MMWPKWYVPPRPMSVGQRVLERAYRATGVDARRLAGDRKDAETCLVRWAVMLVLHDMGWSSPRIGALLGDRDHSTILHGLKRARKLARFDSDFNQTVQAIRA